MAKTSKTAKSERQAKIDQIRSKQKGAERRRGFAIVGVCVVIALLIVGSAWWVSGLPLSPQWFAERKFQKLNLDEIGASASSCQKVETKPATGSSEHVPTGTPVPYKDAPPAFGPHWNEPGVAPAPIARHVYTDDRPELESLVHNLEHGYTILWFDESIAGDDEAMSEINAIADKFTEDNENFRNKFIAAPWRSDDGDAFPNDQHVALTHWSAGGEDAAEGSQVGVWQYCSDVSGEALQDFMLKYPYTDSPEPTAA